MQLNINGETRHVQATRLDEILHELGYDDMFIAIARNQELVPRGTYAEHVLQDGDKLEIIAPMKGG